MENILAFFFEAIVRKRQLHYTKIDENIYLGSCPRSSAHLDLLQDIGVTSVICLQSPEDLYTYSKGDFSKPATCLS